LPLLSFYYIIKKKLIKTAIPYSLPYYTTMKKVLVENISDQMVLAKDVTGTSGSVLLAKGILLTSAMGRRLKNWGVLFVSIEGEDDSSEKGTVPTVSPEQVREQLEKQFEKVMSSEIMKKIFAAVYKFKLQQNS
jgi:hypothetical protein